MSKKKSGKKEKKHNKKKTIKAPVRKELARPKVTAVYFECPKAVYARLQKFVDRSKVVSKTKILCAAVEEYLDSHEDE